MPLEDLTGPSKYISDLNNLWPLGTDQKREGDDHARGTKNVMVNTFVKTDASVVDGPLYNSYLSKAPASAAQGTITAQTASVDILRVQPEAASGIGHMAITASAGLTQGDPTGAGNGYLIESDGSGTLRRETVGEAGKVTFNQDGAAIVCMNEDADTTRDGLRVESTTGAPRVTWRRSTFSDWDFSVSSSGNLECDYSGSLVMRMAQDTSQFLVPYVYQQTTANAADVQVSSSGLMRRSTSTLAVKNVLGPIEAGVDIINKLKPIFFKSKLEGDGDKIYAGFGAEDVAAAWSPASQDENYDSRAIVAALVSAVQQLSAEVAELKRQS